jgi:uncharacterized protein YkwD
MTAIQVFRCILFLGIISSGGAVDDALDPTVNELLAAHNFIRKRNKLEPLTLSSTLCKSAEIQARDMANQERMSHTGSDGSNPIQRARRVGYGSNYVGENVAVSQWTVDEVMTGWMDSRGHRRNILSKSYTEMGAARVQDELGNYFWCVNFGNPKRPTRTAPRKAAPGVIAITNPINEEAAAALVQQINRTRQAGGQRLLKADATLGRAAMAVSAAMAAKESLAIDGEPFKSFDRKALVSWDIRLRVGADIPTPQEAARQLVGDRDEELAAFSAIGAGYALSKSGTPYWCAIFARPVGLKRPTNTK